ncbi:MAG TPA: hypothetical protein VHW73_11745 [Rudaea sp.]|jgi:hypothetical protein|nr:hypothetical protein [Rudaea sp.]
MKRAVLFVLGCISSSSAFAANEYGTGEHVVHVRDTEAQLISALGEPARKVEVDNSRGSHMGDYYIYELSKESVRFYLEKGRVLEITVIKGN